MISFRLTLPQARYAGPDAAIQFYDQLEQRIGALPGVASVGTNYQLPLSSVALAWEPIGIEGYVPARPGGDRIISSSAYVSPGYFKSMGISVVRGRGFTQSDRRGAAEVVLVDDRLAARFWPAEDPIGKRLRQGTDGPWRTVVGVVANTREYRFDAQPPITVFFPVNQIGVGSRFVVVRMTPSADAEPPWPRCSARSAPSIPSFRRTTSPPCRSGSAIRWRDGVLLRWS